MEKVTFGELCKLFPAKTEKELKEIFEVQRTKYDPVGWFLAENHMMGSSKLGSKFLLPYGPNNTYKIAPDHPFSIDGTASGTVCVTHYLLKEDFDNVRTKT